jgi:hypothetical protein
MMHQQDSYPLCIAIGVLIILIIVLILYNVFLGVNQLKKGGLLTTRGQPIGQQIGRPPSFPLNLFCGLGGIFGGFVNTIIGFIAINTIDNVGSGVNTAIAIDVTSNLAITEVEKQSGIATKLAEETSIRAAEKITQ